MPSNVLVRNTCSRSKVEARFEPLVAAAMAIYRDVFEESLIVVYLMGSVPRGEAIAGQSDIDFIALRQGEPQPTDLNELAAST